MTDVGFIITLDMVLGKTLGSPILRASGMGQRGFQGPVLQKGQEGGPSPVQGVGIGAATGAADRRQAVPAFQALGPAPWGMAMTAPRALTDTQAEHHPTQLFVLTGPLKTEMWSV